jgi:hypothetical protein
LRVNIGLTKTCPWAVLYLAGFTINNLKACWMSTFHNSAPFPKADIIPKTLSNEAYFIWQNLSSIKSLTFLHWLGQSKCGLDTLDHYLDDFLFAEEPLTNNCQILMESFTKMCQELGVPIADKKTVGNSYQTWASCLISWFILIERSSWRNWRCTECH